jgi:hypothetical protein
LFASLALVGWVLFVALTILSMVFMESTNPAHKASVNPEFCFMSGIDVEGGSDNANVGLTVTTCSATSNVAGRVVVVVVVVNVDVVVVIVVVDVVLVDVVLVDVVDVLVLVVGPWHGTTSVMDFKAAGLPSYSNSWVVPGENVGLQPLP